MDHNTFLAIDLAVKIFLLLFSYCNSTGQLICSEIIEVGFFFLLFKCSSEVVSQACLNITTVNERLFLKCTSSFLPRIGTRAGDGFAKAIHILP